MSVIFPVFLSLKQSESLNYGIEKGQSITISLIVAEVFNKRHDNVMRDIKNLSCSNEFRLLNFALMVEMRKLSQERFKFSSRKSDTSDYQVAISLYLRLNHSEYKIIPLDRR